MAANLDNEDSTRTVIALNAELAEMEARQAAASLKPARRVDTTILIHPQRDRHRPKHESRH
jgi:hypothetical protein